MMNEEKCEKCGSTNGFPHYCSGFGCGRDECGALKYFSCKDCGHMTSFYHITAKGEEVLEILLEPEDEVIVPRLYKDKVRGSNRRAKT